MRRIGGRRPGFQKEGGEEERGRRKVEEERGQGGGTEGSGRGGEELDKK